MHACIIVYIKRRKAVLLLFLHVQSHVPLFLESLRFLFFSFLLFFSASERHDFGVII